MRRIGGPMIADIISTKTSPTGGNTMRLLAIAAALASMLGAAAAQDYPTRPINVIVPAAAGGPTDAISRITAQAMSKILGQQIKSRTPAAQASPSAPAAWCAPIPTVTLC